MEDDACGHGDVEACSFLSILRNVDKVVAEFLMNWYHSSSFIAEKEDCISLKRMLVHWYAPLADLNSTDFDASLREVLFALFQ